MSDECNEIKKFCLWTSLDRSKWSNVDQQRHEEVRDEVGAHVAHVAIRVGPAVGHAQDARAGVPQLGMDLILELVAIDRRSSPARA